jgi:hypothetical protein
MCVSLQLCSPLRHKHFARYINDLRYHSLFLNITSSVIDFMFFTRQYPWCNSETNGRITPSTTICCKQSLPTRSRLFQTSLCIATITVSVILQQIGRLATFIGYGCVENNEVYFLFFTPLSLERHPVSRGLVRKITTIHVKLKDDKYKNVTWSTTCHSNSTS